MRVPCAQDSYTYPYIAWGVDERTTLQVPRPLLAKIRKAGHKGQTYAEIIEEALRALERQRMEELHWQIAQDVMAGKAPYRVL